MELTSSIYDLTAQKQKVKEMETAKKEADSYKYERYAEAFLKSNGSVYRYHLGRVFRYVGTHYIEQTDLGTQVINFMRREKIPVSNNVVGNTLPIVKAIAHCDSRDYPDMPFWVGKAPVAPDQVVAFSNGLLSLPGAIRGETGLIPHTPEFVSLNCVPYAYDPGADCPRWIAFLEEIFEGDQDRIALLQEFAGYLLTADTSRQKMLALLGVSRGGKGTTATVLQALMGKGNYTAYDLSALADKFGKGSLVGKNAAFIGEVNLQKHPHKYAILSSLNSIIGCDPVEVEYKHNPIKTSVVLPTRFVISCNHFPNFADPSGALAERVLVLNFQKAVPEDKRDPELAAKLCDELSGIANWAIQGLARLQATGKFTRPALAAETTNKIRRNASPVVAFAQDRLKVSRSLDTGNLPGIEIVDQELSVNKATVMEAYAEWIRCHSIEANPNYLRRDLEEILPKMREVRSKVQGSRILKFEGIDLKPEA